MNLRNYIVPLHFFLVFFHSCNFLAQGQTQKSIRLRTDPTTIETDNSSKSVRFFVLVKEIPSSVLPATFYRPMGKLFMLDPLGRETYLGPLDKKMEILNSEGKPEGPGLEGIFQIDVRSPRNLKFFAKLEAENNWSAITQREEFRIVDAKEFNDELNRRMEASKFQVPVREEMNKTTVRDYAGMRKACQESGCCLASVAYMEKHKAFRISSGDCPSDHKRDIFKCNGSLTWCEPKTNK